MIPNNSNIAVVDNNLGGHKIHMKIDADSTVHLMSLLTDLYSDPEMACLREYSTNAYDSHLDAGQTRPIEVTTPTSLYPYLRIQDWGIGMDGGTIEDIYSQYGKSTKREDKTTNGSMGIGGKSALAYTNQFSVIGVKDGIKTHVSVSRDADGSGVMEIVDESLTDDPNGVEIVIPTKRSGDFTSKAKRLFRFWAKGTVLLNGVAPEVNLTKVSDRIYTIDNGNSYDDDVIVMGNVAYPVVGGLHGGDSIHRYGNRKPLAAFVTMNGADEVVFTPSREGLNNVPKTTAVVTALREEYRAAVIKNIQDSIVLAKSFGEAYRAFLAFEKKYATSLLSGVLYKNTPMPVGYVRVPAVSTNPAVPSTPGATVSKRATVWNVNQSRYAVSSNSEISYEQIMDSLIIINYPMLASGISGPNKAKIREYRDQKGINGRYVIVLPEATVPGAPWTDEATVADWTDIKKIVLTASTSNYASKSYAGGYDVWDDSKGWYEIKHDLAKTDEIVYYSKASLGKEYLSRSARELITTHLPNAYIVEASENRHDKLIRLFPKALGLRGARDKIAKKVCDSLTPLEKEMIKIKSVQRLDYLDGIDYNSIDDPFLKRALEVHRMKDTAGTKAFSQIDQSARDKVIKTLGSPELTDITSRYPLLNWNPVNKKDFLLYVNAKYNSLPKGK